MATSRQSACTASFCPSRAIPTGGYGFDQADPPDPAATDSYTVTYVGAGTTQAWSGVTRTVTQPLVTRDAFGRVIDRPLRTVA